MNLGLLITTCQHYFKNIPNVINDIEQCKFPKENVLIVSGQENDNLTYYEKNVKIVKVTYTGLHLTGVIYLCENRNLFNNINYWIILPDTIKINKLFYINIMKCYNTFLKNNEIYSLPFINPVLRPTMDMGIVNIKHIYNMSDYLSKIKKELPYDKDTLLNLKTQLIFDENTMLGLTAAVTKKATKFKYHNPFYPKPNIFVTNRKCRLIEKKIYINNKLCNQVYLVNLDILKYQRNFSGIEAKLIMEL
jgi:hypothetical protein